MIELVLKEIYAGLEQIRAIETLEYHNKNFLSGDNASRSVEKVLLCDTALKRISELRLIRKSNTGGVHNGSSTKSG